MAVMTGVSLLPLRVTVMSRLLLAEPVPLLSVRLMR